MSSEAIPLASPLEDNLEHYDHILDAIAQSIQKGDYILGDEVTAFETAFTKYIGSGYSVGVANGTDAITLALRTIGVRPGDEVITTSLTALATLSAICQTGATPILVDIEEDFYTIDIHEVANALSSKTKAIVPIHIYGQPANLSALKTLADKNHLPIIEDCAQAHGATYYGTSIGCFGELGCFSFYPTKNLGAIGDAGLVTCKNVQYYNQLKALRQYGWDTQRISYEISCNSRLDSLQAAILQVKLQHLENNIQKRNYIAEQYIQAFRDLPLVLPKPRDNCRHAYHLFVIQTNERDNLMSHLQKHNIQAGIHYHPLPHEQPGYQHILEVRSTLKVTNKIKDKILSLPMYPQLTKSNQDKIIRCIQEFFSP